MFDLVALLALAADTPAASAIDLSPTTILLCQALLGQAYNLEEWTGAGLELTEAEIEQIHDLISLAEGEILP